MSTAVGLVLDIARSQLSNTDPARYRTWLQRWTDPDGDHGGPGDGGRCRCITGHGRRPTHDRWAAAFCAWVFAAAGAPATDTGRYANCGSWATWFQTRGRLAHTPVPGAIVFFDWDRDGTPEHMGLVEGRREDGRLITIEGDTDRGDGRPVAVHRMVRGTSREAVLGYGLPFYDGRPG